MKRWLIILLTIVISASLMSISAFAAEDEGETGGDTIISLDGATVNVSPESIQAIAEAVAAVTGYTYKYPYQYWVTLKDGTRCLIDSDIADMFELYDVSILLKTSGNYVLRVYIPDDFTVAGTADNPLLQASTQMTSGTSGKAGQFYNDVLVFECVYQARSSKGWSTDISSVMYSTHHWITPDGATVYISDSAPAPVYTVSFYTGFDDLFINSQSSNSLELPRPLKDGYIFLGWYLDENCINLYTSGYEFTSDITLYAKWAESMVGELGPMAFFSGSVFDSLTVLLDTAPIFYLISLMALVVIFGIIKLFVSTRI